MLPDRTTFTRRISWQAIFAGLVAALGVQLFLGMMGLAITASTIQPTGDGASFTGVATGTAIWFVVSSMISLFVGGWVAGRLSGIHRTLDAALHGFVTWGFASLVMMYLVSTTLGSVLSGTAGVLSRGISALGQGLASTAPQIAEGLSSSPGVTELKNEVVSVLNQYARSGAEVGATGQPGSAQDASQTANSILGSLFKEGGQIDRDAAINALTANTNMNRQQASAAVDRWIENYNQAKSQVAESARQMGDTVAKGVTQTAGWTTAVLLLGGIAGTWGGAMGRRKEDEVDTIERL